MERTLWLSSERLALVRRLLAHGEPTAVAIQTAALQTGSALENKLSDTESVVALAVAAALGEDAPGALRALEAWLTLAEASRERGNLGRADVALAGAAVLDACGTWAAPLLVGSVRTTLRNMALAFREPDLAHGDPHIVTNNHWGVSHAAAAMAAMAADDGSAASMELIEWARGRTRAYLRLHGDAGLYHEGIGYQLYPAAYWLAYILASRGFDGTDELEVCPGLRRAGLSLYALSRPAPCRPGEAPFRGHLLSWNDSGNDWCDSGAAVLLAALAPEEQRGALRTLFDARNGVRGDRRFGPRHAGLFFALAAYPFETGPGDPDRVLPRFVVDSRQGFVAVRNGYRGADDAILGGYARCAHPGGHAHDDAGSLRLAAFGHDWIVGGGQARPAAEWQSLVTPADGQRPSKPYACGALVWCEPTERGGIFGFDLRRPSMAYAERWVAVRFGEDHVDVVVLDTLDDHTSRDWRWNLTVGAGLAMEAHADGAGFDWVAADGVRLSSRFPGQRPDGLETLRMPDSSRTYQGGQRETYPGLPVVRAHFANHPHRAITWVARIGRGPRVDIRLAEGPGLNLVFGDDSWSRPFGAGLAATFDPLRGGTPSRHPNGV